MIDSEMIFFTLVVKEKQPIFEIIFFSDLRPEIKQVLQQHGFQYPNSFKDFYLHSSARQYKYTVKGVAYAIENAFHWKRLPVFIKTSGVAD